MTFKQNLDILVKNMVSKMEQLVQIPAFLLQGSIDVAHGAEQRTRELLERQLHCLGETNAIDSIVQSEVRGALLEYGEKRLDGHTNDACSQEPGLTAYLTPRGLNKVVKICEKAGYPIPPAQIIEILPTLIALQLPKGVYDMGRGSAHFCQEAIPNWINSQIPIKSFSIPYRYVVRVEGSANELWQNFHYQWDGSPRA